MAFQTWETLINAYQTSGNSTGAAYKKSTTLTDISPGGNTAGQALTIPASFLVPGNILSYRAAGIFSTTSAPTIILGLYYGGVAGVALAETVAITTVSGGANITWMLEATSRVVSTGTSGKILTQGSVVGVEAKSLAGTSAGTTMMPEESSTAGEATINTSESKILTVGAKWGTESESNTITCYQWLVEILN